MIHGSYYRRQATTAIAQALASLPPTYREAIVESYAAGRTTRQTAEALGLPHDTVKSRIYHGLRHLRQTLREQGWPDKAPGQ
ncbi:sigma factor-like helix-turn-helix DNA-binding protein [Streptomyces sp. NPDC005209]|uniref:sigma factor-like helix-turn-helix DNA-binding protein n=1 Tax=Streptomyces sp. NPDC005209 TaxID=3156715 RepID=UPI0033A4F6EE